MTAIRDAALQQLRPILMTSASTILGLLPLTVATGEGANRPHRHGYCGRGRHAGLDAADPLHRPGHLQLRLHRPKQTNEKRTTYDPTHNHPSADTRARTSGRCPEYRPAAGRYDRRDTSIRLIPIPDPQAPPTEVLSLRECLQLGLERNYDIRIVRNEERISDNNATAANAGKLPTIDLSAGYGSNVNRTHDSAHGRGHDRQGALTTARSTPEWR